MSTIQLSRDSFYNKNSQIKLLEQQAVSGVNGGGGGGGAPAGNIVTNTIVLSSYR